MKNVALSCLKAEMQKARNSMALWLSIVGTIANLLLFFGLHWAGEAAVGGFSAQNWGQYVVNHYDGIAFMMLPLYVIILCSLVFLMEYRSQMWVQLFTLPVSRWAVYSGKILFLLILFLGAHLLFILGFLLTGLLFGLLHPGSGFLQQMPPWLQILELAFRTFLSILGLLGLHTWLSLRFQHFIVPLLIGILGYVVTGLLGPAWPWQFLNPYAPTFLFMPQYRGELQLPTLGWLSWAEWMSIAFFILFLFLAYRRLERVLP
ncbi:MAG: ABC transporter permease [Phaeodactylibacter sp.]|nr:ABC transporter permease [Phaeodactylibacter sp.]MCB9301213.1 ABC transporter permease [Lewinellaceae bacterium]HQU58594.1 ABC transporter permease [Saprospiraceae bacterium]